VTSSVLPTVETSHRAPLSQRLAVNTQHRRWQRRADSWEDHASVALGSVVEAVLAEVGPAAHGVALDIGCGGGALAVPLAARAATVVAVDISPNMIDRLHERAALAGADNVDARVGSIELLDFPPGSIDVVVSNYALHHLRDRDKQALVQKAAVWLSPGGRLVIGDMMLGRGFDREDREVIAGKVKLLARRGPAGWWRVAKNGWRLMTRTVERPVPMAAWTRMLESAGFEAVSARRLVAEAGVVSGTRPS